MAKLAPKTQPSFYYMLIAQTCVQRSRAACNETRSQALRDAARDYRAMATCEYDNGPSAVA
jgi:hypothetical protein